MDAVLIAGGRVSPSLSEVAGHSVKGLFQLGDSTQIVRTLHALERSGVERIAVVGSELLLHALPTLSVEVMFASEGDDPVDNLWRGVERLGLSSQARFLHCAVDLPMITGEAVCEFLHAAPADADAVMGWTPESAFTRAFPNAPYKALQFAEGRFLSASVSVLRVGFLEAHAPLMHRLARARKSAFKVAFTLVRVFHHHLITTGLPLTARFLTGRLALRQIELYAERLLHARLRCCLSAAPELAYDVDDEADYRYAQAWLQTTVSPHTPLCEV
ncbi:MAG: NTP transferase domain-containing protein [Fimbriimonadales bacterium]|nr:NTP transferase domain-containing protein [Fimbriimonadales bacterium]